jgi:hypothetical protein
MRDVCALPVFDPKDAVATTVGVIVFWPTLFLIGGDKQNAAQLAQLKGQMDA